MNRIRSDSRTCSVGRTLISYFPGVPLIWPGVSGPVAIIIDVYYHCGTIYAYMGMVMGTVVPAPVTIPMTVVAVIMVMPVRMVSVIVVPVVGSPGAPVAGIVTPVPG